MFDLYGYKLFSLLRQIRNVKFGLRRMLEDDPQALAPSIDPNQTPNLTALAINIAASLAEELSLESTKHQINTLRRIAFLQMPLGGFLDAIGQLEVRIEEDLKARNFLFIDPRLAEYWGQTDLFGLGKKFSAAQADITAAANCLALGQGTACVFHLMRAMEVAVRILSKRIGVTIVPASTWRKMTSEMDDKIKKMPDETQAQKRKKNDWEATRTNLHHVGSVWRNNTMHPAATYSPSQALDVLRATRVFMASLCTL